MFAGRLVGDAIFVAVLQQIYVQEKKRGGQYRVQPSVLSLLGFFLHVYVCNTATKNTAM